MEGRAATVRGAPAGVLGDGRERDRRLGRFVGQRDWPRRRIYPALPRHGSGRGTAAPRSVARQSPATSAVSVSGLRHVSFLPRHHAWRGIGIWPR